MERGISPQKHLLSRKGLILIAAIIWFAGGCLLISRETLYIIENSHHILFHILIGVGGGFLLYLILFSMISENYIYHIINFEQDDRSVFSYSNNQEQFFIIAMICIGLALKATNLIDGIYLSITFVCIGFAFIFSSVKFLYFFAKFKKLTHRRDV